MLKLLTLSLVTLLIGCASNIPIEHTPNIEKESPQKLVVLMDGTANDEASFTNVSKLHNLIALQSNPNTNTVYVHGVGTNGKFIGMAMGWGIGHDVREAYRYLGENYSRARDDEVYIFGFSRGAYASRILASLLNTAGIPEFDVGMTDDKKDDLVDDIYSAFKGEKTLSERQEAVSKVIGKQPQTVNVTFMGLWDTVEALGWPDYDENIDVPNGRYGDQLCNINKAAHALSLDDDRARIFTPILLTRNHLISDCKKKNINETVDEVWFSGAHSDVGGGYEDTELDGVSLNWMINKLQPFDLLPSNSGVYEDPLGVGHDPESGFFFGLIYYRLNRNLPLYTQDTDYNNGKLNIHSSVFERLANRKVLFNEFNWVGDQNYKECFNENSEFLDYIETSNCFDKVN